MSNNNTQQAIRAAAKALAATYLSATDEIGEPIPSAEAEWKNVARSILDQFGNKAKSFDKITLAYQTPVLIELQARLEVRTALDESTIDRDAANVPKERQDGRYVRGNWVWCVRTERFYRISDCEQWSVRQFDSWYNNLSQRGSYSAQLFGNDTIRKVERTAFNPGRPIFLNHGTTFNLWRPSRIEPIEGDVTLWKAHLEYLYPNVADRARVVNWLAWGYRNMDKKPNTALLLVGKNTGTGKSWIAAVFERLIGPENTQRPKASSLKGEFNAWQAQCKLCIIEELMMIGRREAANNLKDTITEKTVEVNIKNISAHKVENHLMIMATTNHDNAVPLDDVDTRWEVIGTKAEKKDHEYYVKLWKILDTPALLSAIAYELLNCNIGDYNGLDRTDYRSEDKQKMIDNSVPGVTKWLRGQYQLQAYPFNLQLLSIRHDILTPCIIPDDVQKEARQGYTLETLVTKFISDELKGDNFDKATHRVREGTEVRRMTLWGINGGQTHFADTDIGTRARAYVAAKETARTDEIQQQFNDDKAAAEIEIEPDIAAAEIETDPLTGEPSVC